MSLRGRSGMTFHWNGDLLVERNDLPAVVRSCCFGFCVIESSLQSAFPAPDASDKKFNSRLVTPMIFQAHLIPWARIRIRGEISAMTHPASQLLSRTARRIRYGQWDLAPLIRRLSLPPGIFSAPLPLRARYIFLNQFNSRGGAEARRREDRFQCR